MDVAKGILFFTILEKNCKRTALGYLATMVVEVVFLGIGSLCLLMIVGVHHFAHETRRLHEYSPGFAPERFAAHEGFFVEDVATCVHDRYNPNHGS